MTWIYSPGYLTAKRHRSPSPPGLSGPKSPLRSDSRRPHRPSRAAAGSCHRRRPNDTWTWKLRGWKPREISPVQRGCRTRGMFFRGSIWRMKIDLVLYNKVSFFCWYGLLQNEWKTVLRGHELHRICLPLNIQEHRNNCNLNTPCKDSKWNDGAFCAFDMDFFGGKNSCCTQRAPLPKGHPATPTWTCTWTNILHLL